MGILETFDLLILSRVRQVLGIVLLARILALNPASGIRLDGAFSRGASHESDRSLVDDLFAVAFALSAKKRHAKYGALTSAATKGSLPSEGQIKPRVSKFGPRAYSRADLLEMTRRSVRC